MKTSPHKTSTRAMLLATAMLAAGPSAFATDGTWLTDVAGNWSDTANWNAGTLADGTDAIANFNNLDLAAGRTVTLDTTSRTVGTLNFDDTGATGDSAWTLASSGGATLTLATSTGAPSIVTTTAATISAELQGSNGFTKTGGADLILSGTNTGLSGNISLGGGILRVASSDSALGTGTVAFTANSTLATNLGGGARTLANAITIATGVTASFDGGYADLTLNGNISGAGGFTKTSSGNVILGGTNSWAGATNVNSGTLTFAGTSSLSGTSSFVVNGGAVNQTGGTVSNIGAVNAAIYLTVGNGNYGSYNLSGGSLTTNTGNGFRIGYGSAGSFVQSGGTLSSGRWFAIGGSNTSGNGVATFTGGTATVNSSYRFIVGDNGGTGVMNVGTQAGGNAQLTTANTTGLTINGAANGNGTLNLNSGTVTLSAAINKGNATGTATLNLNGGTLRAGAATTALIASTNGLVANMYNGGLTVDTNGNNATIAANLVATTGNGVYAGGSAGVISNTGAQGAGYIGNPLVTVSGGTGTGATAIANIVGGKVTGVTLTNPGQNYSAGDVLTFTLAGGGASTAISSFTATLSAADLAANASGGLTKNGTGTLTLSGVNTFIGNTTVANGTLALADNAGLKFMIGANGVNNGISGTGTLTLDGDFTFDLTAAATAGTWQIVDNNALTETYTTNFTVAGFTDNLDNTWSKSANGTTYTFSEATGALSAVPEPSAALIGGLGVLALLRRRRR